MKRLLFIEDDPTLGKILFERLEKDYQVIWSSSFQESWLRFSKNPNFDLVIFDVNLSDGSGFDLAEKFLKVKPQLPFIFLTAQSDAESRLRGFEIGAQEYIPKPFHLKELLMRVEHVLKNHSSLETVSVPGVLIDLSGMSLQYKDGSVEYPPVTDMKVLKLLIDRSPRVLSRDEIIDLVWGQDRNISHRSVDNVILRLRALFKNQTEDEFIRSARGVGYQWINPAPDSTKNLIHPTRKDSNS
jgi:DNA-binding response OmpR family regulator